MFGSVWWRRLGWTTATVVAAVVVSSLVGAGDPRTNFVPAGPGLPVPTDTLPATTRRDFSRIVAGLAGRPVVVNVWASWCAPCRAEMPLLQRAARGFEGRVAFIGVDSRDDRAEAEEFLGEVGVSYPNLFDGTGDIRRTLGVRAFPTTYVFDRRGRLRSTVVGGITEQRLVAQLEDLLTS